MKNTILLMTLAAFVVSCGSPDKKAELEALLKQQDELSGKIEKLREELAKENKDSSDKKISLVTVTPIVPQAFLTFIDVQGRVDAEENVNVTAEIPGTITRINVHPGDEVSKGEVLAETDARAIQQSISSLQSNLELITQLYEKQKALWEQKIGTEVQYLQAKTNKESVEKQLSALQEQLRMSKIISPIDGTVDGVDIKVAQAVVPGFPAIRIINFSNLKIKAELAESYADRVKKGDVVKIYFPDVNDSTESVVNYAARTINNSSRTFTIEAILDNKKNYHPNMVAKIKINDYKSPQPVITVPVKLLQTTLSGEKFVYVAKGIRVEKRVVNTGREYNGRIEIIRGLKEGDGVITEGYDNINEGETISFKK